GLRRKLKASMSSSENWSDFSAFHRSMNRSCCLSPRGAQQQQKDSRRPKSPGAYEPVSSRQLSPSHRSILRSLTSLKRNSESSPPIQKKLASCRKCLRNTVSDL